MPSKLHHHALVANVQTAVVADVFQSHRLSGYQATFSFEHLCPLRQQLVNGTTTATPQFREALGDEGTQRRCDADLQLLTLTGELIYGVETHHRALARAVQLDRWGSRVDPHLHLSPTVARQLRL